MSAVLCRGVSKYYRQHAVLTDVSLRVDEGQIYCLLGPNGAGKTTLMNIVTGQVRASAGDVAVYGRDPIGQRRLVLGDLGIVVSGARGLWWRLTGLENLLRSAALYQMRPELVRNRASELLDRLGLSKHQHQLAGLYSTGMKVRLALARALMHDPRLLVLDEPWSGLDPQGKVDLVEILRSLVRDNRAVLIASHELPQVEEVADRIGVLINGRLSVEGSRDELVSLLPFRYVIRRHDQQGLAEEVQYGDVGQVADQLSVWLQQGAAEIEVRRGRIEDVYFHIRDREHGQCRKDDHDGQA